MTVFGVIGFIVELFILLYVIVDLISAARNIRYQKVWRLKKSSIVRIDPNITRAELCEEYVMFCKRNNCKVDF